MGLGVALEYDRQHCITLGIVPFYWVGDATKDPGHWALLPQDGTPIWSMVVPVHLPRPAGGRRVVQKRGELWASPWVLGTNWVRAGTRVRHIPGSSAELWQPVEFGSYNEAKLGGKPLSVVYIRLHNVTAGEVEIALGGKTMPGTLWGEGLFRWCAGAIDPEPATIRVIPSANFEGEISLVDAWEDRFPVIDSPGLAAWTHTELVCRVNSYGDVGADVTIEVYELPDVTYSPIDPQPGGRDDEPLFSERITGSEEPVQKTFQLSWEQYAGGGRAFQVMAYHEGDTAVQMLAAYVRRFRFSR